MDGNTFDCRKSNLRNCTTQENGMNHPTPANNTSGRKGVTWNKKEEKWMSYICYKQKSKTLGYFDDFEDASNCRKIAEEKYFKEFNRL